MFSFVCPQTRTSCAKYTPLLGHIPRWDLASPVLSGLLEAVFRLIIVPSSTVQFCVLSVTTNVKKTAQATVGRQKKTTLLLLFFDLIPN